MKKLSLLLFSLLLILALAACNSSDDDSSKDNTKKEDDKETVEVLGPIEPTSEDKCAGCNMKIYLKDEEMGQFTAQALTEDGEYLFFDDSGCLLNAPRKTGETYAETWVRDFYTLEWLETEDALAVHSDIATPMKMGNAFFSSQADVDLFMNDYADLNPTVVTWDDIDAVAFKRYQQKMQNQQNNSDEGSSENSHS